MPSVQQLERRKLCVKIKCRCLFHNYISKKSFVTDARNPEDRASAALAELELEHRLEGLGQLKIVLRTYRRHLVQLKLVRRNILELPERVPTAGRLAPAGN